MNDPQPCVPTFGALILAGGRSSRMGTDKANLPYRGKTLLTHMRDIALHAGASAIITGGGAHGEIQDPVPDAGPVGGLCALAAHAALAGPARWLVIPVDMPLLTPALLTRLAGVPSAATAYAQHPLPLAVTFDARSISVFTGVRARLSAGESVPVRQVLRLLEATELQPSAAEKDQLVNANTPQDWRHLTTSENASGGKT